MPIFRRIIHPISSIWPIEPQLLPSTRAFFCLAFVRRYSKENIFGTLPTISP